MAGTIKISPDTMRSRANEYRQQGNAVGDVITRMDSLLSQLQQEWEGEASTSYADRYNNDLRKSFVAAQELIEEIATALDQTATALEEQDAQIGAMFKG